MKKKIDILYEDKNLLIINKPSKLLTISTAKEKNNTLYQKASEYVKKQYPKNKVFIVNRQYRAIVEGQMPKNKDTLKNYLFEDKTMYVHVSKKDKGNLAITNYEVLAYQNTYSYLKVTIETGKKNQIRVQLKEIGHPIIGDKKYQSKRNPIGRLGLHASYMELKIPGYKEILKIKAKTPAEFNRMFEVN